MTRERDELGRPLPPGVRGVDPVPEDALPPGETLTLARDLLRRGRPFSAHEVLEARWKAAPASEKALWQGLAQLAVGLTHEARGNAVGAARLLRRGAGRLDEHAASAGPTYDLPLGRLVRLARRRADRLDPTPTVVVDGA